VGEYESVDFELTLTLSCQHFSEQADKKVFCFVTPLAITGHHRIIAGIPAADFVLAE
jgi:hypothetical protein